jgi:large subunit ribosomal protein L18
MAKSTRELRLRRHQRVRRKLTGTAARPRVAVSRTARHFAAQIINDEAGTTVAAVSTVEPTLRATPATVAGASAVGTVLAQRARAAGVTAVVFDRGGFAYHGRVAAFADALRAGGLEF